MVSESGDRDVVPEGPRRIQVLDHGYVALVEAWGSDERIIEAARMSTNKGFEGWGPTHTAACVSRLWERVEGANGAFWYMDQSGENHYAMRVPPCDCEPKTGDEKLLRYLWTHHHTTPFEMAGLTIEVQAPIFVFREWHRHRTQSYNEMSARYTPLPEVNYMPTVERCNPPKTENKQAKAMVIPTTGEPATDEQLALSHGDWLRMVADIYARAEYVYQQGLLRGVPKEVARVVMPVGRYSRMRASTDLWNWLHFLKLRMASDAQWEIRQYANVVGDLVAAHFPRTWALFAENPYGKT
jgi:thymidylate synthase (FAD)